jgi:UDP-glucose 4-epimerase
VQILVTGGAGFIGTHLIRQLLSDSVEEVRVIDDFSSGFRRNLEGVAAKVYSGSILDRELLGEASRGVDAIIHLAARPSVPRSIRDPLTTHHSNVTGTLHVLEAARLQGAHVVLASSSSVYGANPYLPKHEDLRPIPISPYAVSKLATESYGLAYQHAYGLSVIAFRFFNVYGPLQAAGHPYAAVIPQFALRALQGKPLIVHGDGLQSRDFTYVETVVEVLSRAARQGICSIDPVNLAFGTRYTLLEIIALMEADLGIVLNVRHVDGRAGDVRDSQADGSRLACLLPDLTPVALKDGLAVTLKWMRQELVGTA